MTTTPAPPPSPTLKQSDIHYPTLAGPKGPTGQKSSPIVGRSSELRNGNKFQTCASFFWFDLYIKRNTF